MTKYAGLMAKSAIPQSEPLDAAQVQNNAGGFVYEVDDWKRLERFLILGSSEATFYQSARALTRENASVVEQCWLENPVRTAATIEGISVDGRAPKNDPAIFALALGALSSSKDARKTAYTIVGRVCRTGTHLFQFVATARAIGKGFGRGMKRAIAEWYNGKPVDRLAYQMVKYRNRERLTHENLLDLSHPKTADPARNALYAWGVGKLLIPDFSNHEVVDVTSVYVGDVVVHPLIIAHERAMKTSTARELLPIIEANPDLPWEALPTWANADAEIRKALLPNMGLTALIRNLGNLTRIGAVTPLSEQERIVVAKLQDGDEIKRSRVHPMAVLTALAAYGGGLKLRGAQRNPYSGSAPAPDYTPNQKIIAALDDAFYKAFQNVVPAGKRFFIGVDCSASMAEMFSGSKVVTCAQAAAAMALVIARTEPWTFIGRFNNGIEPVKFNERSSLGDVMTQIDSINGGGTDCSLPMTYAMTHRMDVDTFIVITDNETWAGRIHPMEALRQYRKATGIPAKLVVIGMTSSGFSIADPRDAGALDVVGFDTVVPALISEFAKA